MSDKELSAKKPRKRRQPRRQPTPMLAEIQDNDNGRAVTVVTPAGCEVARRMQAEGCPEALTASVLGMGRMTLRDCAKRQPELADAMAAGAGELEGELVKLLMDQARGGYAAAAMFLLKSKCGYREQGPADGGSSQAVQVNIQIPPPMSDAEFKAIVDGTMGGTPEQAVPIPSKVSRR